MFSKMILPLFGSTPNVWTTSMMFYQAVLVSGYAFAHLSTRALSVQSQILVQILLLVSSFMLLPITIPETALQPQTSPMVNLLTILLTTVGLPLFTLSVTAPLLQYWFSHTRYRQADNPYTLYAASNAGSMVGLIAYPFLLEPLLTLRGQNILWQSGFIALIIFTIISAAISLIKYSDKPKTTAYDSPLVEGNIPWRRKLRWLILAFVPSSLMLVITTLYTSNIAAVPLFWMLPLAVYLLTFILSFREREILPHEKLINIPIFMLTPIILALISGFERLSEVFLIPWLLLAIFASGMLCHRELYLNRPTTKYLTEFYFFLSLGGVMGGIFNSVIAVLCFDDFYELPITIAILALLTPVKRSEKSARQSPLIRDLLSLTMFTLALAGASFAVYYGWKLIEDASGGVLALWLLLINMLALKFCFEQIGKPFRLAMSLFILYAVGYGAAEWRNNTILTERSFFGIVKVEDRHDYKMLKHGGTLHGLQLKAAGKRLTPTGYYHRNGPLGQLFVTVLADSNKRSFGLVGLGVGTTLCLADKNDDFAIYEIDPMVADVASNPEYFTFLEDCPPTHTIIIGDGRISLRQSTDKQFDALIIDAFSSDAIPVHLMTKEALTLYWSRLNPNGVLIMHVTNAYLFLKPVLANISHELGLTGFYRRDDPKGADANEHRLLSEWIIMAKTPNRLKPLYNDARWQKLEKDEQYQVWTDNYSNIIQLLKTDLPF